MTQQRRRLMQAGLGLALWPASGGARERASGEKVLRLAFPGAETNFDPAQISDGYSLRVAEAIFEAPFEWDYLARPYKLKAVTAAAWPIASSDYRTFTLRIRPGIYFADDPAFKGIRRELVAADYVYSLKRHFDPRITSGGGLRILEPAQIAGLDALRQRAIEGKRPLDYDTPVPGLHALDRYTLQVVLGEAAPRFVGEVLAESGVFGAVAREVVEHYGSAIGEHPVGTGAFRLGEWRRSSRIVLERNPGYREMRYDEEPSANDAPAQAIAARMAGRRLPLVDRVEISVIEEDQPRWLAFQQGALDVLELPEAFAALAVPNGRLAPYLERKGVQMDRLVAPTVSIAAVFNCDDPLVGGYGAEKVALRRAIALAWDGDAEIRLLRNGQAHPAQGPIVPLTFGHDPAQVSEMSECDPAKARALLDLYGYIDRDGDGWRERPDGSALALVFSTQSDARSRRLTELWRRALAGIGLRVVFRIAQWPENLKAVRAGHYSLWHFGFGALGPDSDSVLALAYGGGGKLKRVARFDLPAFDALYLAQRHLPDGPERASAMARAAALMVAYMPYKMSNWRIETDLMQPWVVGYQRHPFTSFYRFVDIDIERQQAARR